MPKGYDTFFNKSTERDLEVISLYNKGHSCRGVAKKFNVDKAIISKVLKRNNIQPTKFSTYRDGSKKCPKCNTFKTINNYFKHGKRINSWCKECNKKFDKKRTITYKERKSKNIESVRRLEKEIYKKKRLNPCFVISERLRTSIAEKFYKNHSKSKILVKHLGYEIESLKVHLENQFKDGMSWANYGEWQIDHIRPLASFNLESIEDIKKAWAINNLQPLWAKDNIKKSSFFNGKKHFYSIKKIA